MKPKKRKDASCGNGTMITFSVNTKDKVSGFYDLVLSLGVTDEGLPGLRRDEYLRVF